MTQLSQGLDCIGSLPASTGNLETVFTPEVKMTQFRRGLWKASAFLAAADFLCGKASVLAYTIHDLHFMRGQYIS